MALQTREMMLADLDRDRCINGRCLSPVACEGFRHCRDRHFLDKTDPRYINPENDK